MNERRECLCPPGRIGLDCRAHRLPLEPDPTASSSDSFVVRGAGRPVGEDNEATRRLIGDLRASAIDLEDPRHHNRLFAVERMRRAADVLAAWAGAGGAPTADPRSAMKAHLRYACHALYDADNWDAWADDLIEEFMRLAAAGSSGTGEA